MTGEGWPSPQAGSTWEFAKYPAHFRFAAMRSSAFRCPPCRSEISWKIFVDEGGPMSYSCCNTFGIAPATFPQNAKAEVF
jgi:hypothetical protein